MFGEILSEEKRILSENWATNIVAAFGSNGDSFFVSPLGEEINNRLWDLASVTKLYSLVTILSLHEKGLFDITKKVKDYSSDYSGITDLRIYELLNFSVELATSSRIDKCPSFDEAIDLLHGIQIKNRRTIYSDMGIIITAQLINEINHSELFFRDHTYKILNSVGAQNTFWWKDIPNEITNIEKYDEYRYADGNLIKIETPLKICHDPKSRILDYSGWHSGLFSDAYSVAKFANALLDEKIIHKETLSMLLDTKYDSWDSEKHHHYGLLCNKKIPDIVYSEVPMCCSDNSVAISGYTGCYLLLDFENRLFVFVGSNRVHNRITNISHDDTSFAYPGTKNYVFMKDNLVRTITNELLK